MKLILHLSPSKYIYELQHAFNRAFPFLRLEFYRSHPVEAAGDAMLAVPPTSLLRMAGVREAGDITITGETTVAALESLLNEHFGVNVRVIRLSGSIWLETSMTADWTLSRQNEHGHELSQGSFISHPAEDAIHQRPLHDQ
jgi:hypothetical protein